MTGLPFLPPPAMPTIPDPVGRQDPVGRPRASVCVVGSINADLVVRVPALPRPGETVVGGTFRAVRGGKGANQAVAAARAGARTAMVARVGDDALGREALEALGREGIDTAHVAITAGCPTGVALIQLDRRGENAIAVAGGANDRLDAADVERARPAIEGADALLVQLEVPLDAVRHAVGIARAAGRRVILNPAPARPLDAALLALVDVLTPNETEAEALLARAGAEPGALAAALVARGPAAVVLTCGAAGAIVCDAGPATRVPAFPVTAIDTVAAGDVYSACLAVALAEGQALAAAARFAAAGAAISVTREGAQASAPRRDEIDRLLAGA